MSSPERVPATPAPIAIQPVAAEHLPAVCDIVNHYIATSTYNFRTEPQTPAQWRQEWRLRAERYPWLVALRAGRVVGVAYAGPFKERQAYDWAVEVTGYVAPDARRGGVGGALYRRLLSTLDAQGYRTMVGVISLPNPQSVAFHESFGFVPAGRLAAVGFKFDRWCDIGFWQRMNGAVEQPAGPILPVPAG